MKKNKIHRIAGMGLLLSVLMVFMMTSGCYYKQNHDDPTGPYGTGTQGPRMNVTMNPDTLPANGVAGSVITVRLRNLEDNSGMANVDVYVALYGITYNEEGYEVLTPWVQEFLYLENGMSRIQARTDEAGYAYVHVYTRDAFWERGEWDILEGYVIAEANCEIDRTTFVTDARDHFKVYNPYFY